MKNKIYRYNLNTAHGFITLLILLGSSLLKAETWYAYNTNDLVSIADHVQPGDTVIFKTEYGRTNIFISKRKEHQKNLFS